jgi:hypothetical protein
MTRRNGRRYSLMITVSDTRQNWDYSHSGNVNLISFCPNKNVSWCFISPLLSELKITVGLHPVSLRLFFLPVLADIHLMFSRVGYLGGKKSTVVYRGICKWLRYIPWYITGWILIVLSVICHNLRQLISYFHCNGKYPFTKLDICI